MKTIMIALFVSTVAAQAAFAQPVLLVGQNSRRGVEDGRKLAARALTVVGGFSTLRTVRPYPANFAGGVRVAVGDVTGDGNPDLVTAPGPGLAGSPIRYFGIEKGVTPANLPGTLQPFGAAFSGGVFVALGDVNLDGKNELVVGAGRDSSEVRVFDPYTGTQLSSFFAFDPAFAGGVRVATGDLNNDGRAEVIVASGPGGGPQVKVFDGITGAPVPGVLSSFFAYDPAFTGGVNVAVGDVDGDFLRDIVTAPATGVNPIRVFKGSDAGIFREFFPCKVGFAGGVSVATGDVDGDGFADIMSSPLKGRCPIKRFNGATGLAVDTVKPFGTTFRGGSFAYQF